MASEEPLTYEAYSFPFSRSFKFISNTNPIATIITIAIVLIATLPFNCRGYDRLIPLGPMVG